VPTTSSRFDAKSTYNYWRPVDGDRAADTDGNPRPIQDSTWAPLFDHAEPPSYVSLHADQRPGRGRGAGVLFGHNPDHVSFTATWDGVDRSFKKFTERGGGGHEAGGMPRIQ